MHLKKRPGPHQAPAHPANVTAPENAGKGPGPCSLRLQSSCQSHWAHTVSIGILPDKDIPSRAGEVIASSNL